MLGKKGAITMAGETVGLGKTPHGAALRLSVEMRTYTQIRHGAALPPCCDDAEWQMGNLSEVDIFWGGWMDAFLPIDSDLTA